MNSLTLTRFTSASEFRSRTEAFLIQHEAQNNVPLGLITTLLHNPSLYPQPPYLVAVEEASVTLAVAVMTPPYQLVLAHTERREALPLIAHDVRAFRPDLHGVVGPTPASLWFAEIWREQTGQTFRRNMAERIYQLEKVNSVTRVPGTMRAVEADDRSLLLEWLAAFNQEALGEAHPERVERSINNLFQSQRTTRGMFLWMAEGERPVAMAGYGGVTPNGARVGPVYTPPAERRKGYASALVAELSQHLLDDGRKYCFLFTDLLNPTSNHIYQQIGYAPVCDADEYRFNDKP